MAPYNIQIVIFITGGAVMVLELLGTRILAPYLGLSLYVWTSVIGIILAALSIGYALGGRLADKNPNIQTLRKIIFWAAATFLLLTLIKDITPLLMVRLGALEGSLIASLILFLPGSLLLAMVSPYAIKLKLNKLTQTGRTAGDLYAFSTAGSIAGTFLAGYVLIPNFQTSTILIALAIILFGTAFLLKPFKTLNTIKIALLIIGAGLMAQKIERSKNLIASIPSAYAQISVADVDFNGRRARILLTDSEVDSGMYLDSDELVFEYTKLFNLDEYFHPRPERALLLGGGAYSMAKDFLRRFPESSIDVVEIDPKITAAARQYFNLENTPRLTTFHEDGRTFINKRAAKYDIIYNDTFSSYYAIPYQLTTRQAIEAMFDNLAPDGVVLVNIISALDGPMSDFFKAEYKTFQSIFPKVYALAVDSADKTDLVQNIVLVALKNDRFAPPENFRPELLSYLKSEIKPVIGQDVPILTDEFAPVDYYIAKLKVGR